MNLWIFGDSNGIGYNLTPGEMYWGDVLSQSLEFDSIINLARPAVDNFFIYQSKVACVSWYGNFRKII